MMFSLFALLRKYWAKCYQGSIQKASRLLSNNPPMSGLPCSCPMIMDKKKGVSEAKQNLELCFYMSTNMSVWDVCRMKMSSDRKENNRVG